MTPHNFSFTDRWLTILTQISLLTVSLWIPGLVGANLCLQHPHATKSRPGSAGTSVRTLCCAVSLCLRCSELEQALTASHHFYAAMRMRPIYLYPLITRPNLTPLPYSFSRLLTKTSTDPSMYVWMSFAYSVCPLVERKNKRLNNQTHSHRV